MTRLMVIVFVRFVMGMLLKRRAGRRKNFALLQLLVPNLAFTDVIVFVAKNSEQLVHQSMLVHC